MGPKHRLLRKLPLERFLEKSPNRDFGLFASAVHLLPIPIYSVLGVSARLPPAPVLLGSQLTGAATYSTSAGCHSHDRRPLVRSGVVPLSTAELCGVVTPSDSVDHILVHRTAQVFPPGAHGRDGVPPVLLGIVALHCRARRTSEDHSAMSSHLHSSSWPLTW